MTSNSGSIAQLLQQLHAEDEAERIYAAEDLGAAGWPEAVPALFAQLRQESSLKVCEAIFSALEQIESPAVLQEATELFASQNAFLRNQAIVLLQHKGAAALSVLQQKMQSDDPDLRKFVIDTAAGIPGPATEKLLATALRDEDVNVVIAAAEHVGRLRLSSFIPVLLEILEHAAEPMLQTVAFAALLALDDARVWPVICRKYPSAETVPAWNLPLWLEAIGKFGAPDDLALLEAAFLRHGRKIIQPLLDSLETFQTRHGRSKLSANFFGVLREMFFEPLSHIERFQLLRALGGCSAPAEIGEWLFQQVASADKYSRLGAVEGLRRWGDPRLLWRLKERLVMERDPEVHEAMLVALRGEKCL